MPPVIVILVSNIPVGFDISKSPLDESHDTTVALTVVEPSVPKPLTVSPTVKLPEAPVTINFVLSVNVGGVGLSS